MSDDAEPVATYCRCGHGRTSHEPAYGGEPAYCDGFQMAGDPYADDKVVFGPGERGCACNEWDDIAELQGVTVVTGDTLADLDQRLAENPRLDPYRCSICSDFHGPRACPVAVEAAREQGRHAAAIAAGRPRQPERNAEIARRIRAGETRRALAVEYGLSPTRIWQIGRAAR